MKTQEHRHHNLDADGIEVYFHCGNCVDDRPVGESPKEWGRTQTGMLPNGRLRVWCNRCDIPVATLTLSDGEKEMLMNHFMMHGCAHCDVEGK